MAKKKSKKPAKKAAKKTVKKAPSKKKGAKAVRPAKKVAKKASSKKAATAKKETPKTTISPYINFDGNCQEAFNFYKGIFGGQFGYVGRFKEMPSDPNQPPMPSDMGERIMHISLPISKETTLMGSDTAPGFGPPHQAGNNFAVSVTAASKSEADRIFNALGNGGQITMPIADTFWGSYFGMCTDKFGINWMMSFDQRPAK
jgi:PhnB protein